MLCYCIMFHSKTFHLSHPYVVALGYQFILICISLVINEIECLFIHLSLTLTKCLFKSFKSIFKMRFSFHTSCMNAHKTTLYYKSALTNQQDRLIYLWIFISLLLHLLRIYSNSSRVSSQLTGI